MAYNIAHVVALIYVIGGLQTFIPNFHYALGGTRIRPLPKLGQNKGCFMWYMFGYTFSVVHKIDGCKNRFAIRKKLAIIILCNNMYDVHPHLCRQMK